MTKAVIFDFDGTIADTMALVSDIANDVLPDFGRPQGLSQQDIQNIRNMNIPQALKYVNIPAYKLPKLAIVAKQELTNRIHDLKPFNGIIDALKKLNDNEVEMGIVTSNSSKNVMEFLRKNDLRHYFAFVDAGASILGKSRNIKHAIKKQRLSLESCVYVGDEIRDIDASKAVGIKCISVTWGANARQVLSGLNPDYTIDKPAELVKIVLGE